MISIVVPCFNAASTLGQAIDSCLTERQGDDEVVVVDDGSTDGSLDIANSFGENIRVVSGPNRGVSAARNRGIAETRGEWIIFLDADDALARGTLELRRDCARQTPADVIVCDWQELICAHGKSELGKVRCVDFSSLGEDAEIVCAAHVWVTTAALMYRRDLVNRIGGFRGDLPVIQDARFLFDAAYNGATFAHSPHVGALYRVAADSLSRSNPGRFWNDCLVNGTQIEALWRARSELRPSHRQALAAIFHAAAMGLFRVGDVRYLEALDALRRSDLPIGFRARTAELLAKVVGLDNARRIVGIWNVTRRRVAASLDGRGYVRVGANGGH